jgi:hypothetical protein
MGTPPPLSWSATSRPFIASLSDPVEDATGDLVRAIAAQLIDQAGDGWSFDPEWDDPYDWAHSEIAAASAGYGPVIADRLETEAFAAMVDAAQEMVDARLDDGYDL